MPRTLLALLASVVIASAAHAEEALRISTLPFDDQKTQEAVFGLLSRQLTEKLGRTVRFQASQSYDQVISELERGEVDVAFVGAAAFVKARQGGKVRAILRAIRHHSSTYRGLIIVKADSPITKLADLRGKRVAFVDRNSTGGYAFQRLLLHEAGIDAERDVVPVFAGGHKRVVELVARGEVDAGACFESAVDGLAEPGTVRPIARTEPVPGDPVVVRAGLGPALIDKLRSALVALPMTPEGATMLGFAEIDGFVPATDADYDRIAALAVESRDVESKR